MIDRKPGKFNQGVFASDLLDGQGVAAKNTAQAPGAKITSVI
jgi:hypothetical protein